MYAELYRRQCGEHRAHRKAGDGVLPVEDANQGMKRLAVLIVFAAGCLALAQTKGQDPAMKEYAYRYEITKPAFGLKKIEALIHRNPVPESAFRSLTVEERFTYVVLHGEVFSQGCAAFPFTSPAGHKIFARAAEGLGDPPNSQWSAREIRFLLRHRGEVIDLLRETIRSRNRIGANLKMAIDEVAARELVPDMLDVFERDRKDLDILTLCLIMMKDDQYQPFLESTAYRTLYGPVSNERSSLEANRANIDAIESMARAYWRSSAR